MGSRGGEANDGLNFGNPLEERVQLLSQEAGVFIGKRLDIGEGAMLRARAAANKDQVFAHVVEPFVQLLACSSRSGHHGNDRRRTDDDTKAGKDRPGLMHQNGGERDTKGG